LCFEVLAFDDLTECTLSQHIEDQVSVPETLLARCVSFSIQALGSYLWPASSEPRMSLT
jgi:hypothetical protein